MGILANLFGKKDDQQQKPMVPGMDPVFNEQYAQFVNGEYQRRQAERMPFELTWRLNMEYVNGNQYLDINPLNQSLEEIPKFYSHQEREVFNQLGSITETRISRLTRSRPLFKTRPASGDDKDISASKISSMLLSSTWNDQDMNDAYSLFVAWLEFTGTALWKPVWSTRKGRVIYSGLLPKDPNVLQDELTKDGSETPQDQGQNPFMQDQQQMEIREGDIDTAVVPAHEFFPDSSYRNDLKRCRSVIHARAYHIDEIEDMWGVRVEPEDVDVMTLQRSTSSGGLGYAGTTFRSGVAKLKDHAVLKEYYEMPSKRFPKGRFIVVAGEKTLHAGPMPYMLGADGDVQYPFILCTLINQPGTLWGRTIIERCIPIQRRYNAFRNRKAEYLNLVAIGQWTEPDGSIDDDTELNNQPGNIIRYRAMNGAKPEPVIFPSLPASFENEEQTLLAEFTAISGVSELSRFSSAPSGVKSGRALGIAAEQDDTRLSATSTNIANSMVQLGKYWIRLYRQFVKEPRILRNVGSNRDVEVRQWLASDLRSDDVILDNAAALAESPTQRRAMVFDLLAAGLFNRDEISNLSVEGKQKVMEMLEYGHWETENEDMFWLQRNRAKRENDQITQQGIPVPIMDYDDHVVHIEAHNRFRMNIEYDQLLQTPQGQMINKLMMDHVMQHQTVIAKQMMAQQEAQQQQQGQQGTDKKSGPPTQQTSKPN